MSLELGGHAPLIVFDDADVELAVQVRVRVRVRVGVRLRVRGRWAPSFETNPTP